MKLVCEAVCFGYTKGSLIFDNYSRTFRSGITILKGYSGCGKTTLLKILAGYLRIRSGHIATPHGVPLSNTKYRRKEVSYMFQGINLLPLASVERNLQLCAEMAMLPKKNGRTGPPGSSNSSAWTACATKRQEPFPEDRPSARPLPEP